MLKYNCEAIVLKSLNYKDKDKIYTFFTNEYGKISATGRGVRKISSKRGGSLDSLNYINIKITETSNGYKNIDEVVVIDSFKNIKKDYLLATKAFYFAEILNKNTEENNNDPNLFKLLKKCLQMLDYKKVDTDLITLFFEVHLLKELGYFPNVPKNNLNISNTLKQILALKINSLNKNDILQTSNFISSYIKENLNVSLKSLTI